MTPQLSPESLEQIRTIVEAIIVRAFEDFERRQNARFETIDRQFDTIDQRFEAVDQQFESVNQQFEAVNQRFEAVNQHFEAVNEQFAAVNQQFGVVNEQFAGLRQETRHLIAENRRHFGVLDEDLRSRMDVVIEGQIGLRETMERGFKATDARIDGLDRRLVRMSARIPVRRRRR